MYTYKIDKVEPISSYFFFHFSVFNSGELIAQDIIRIDSSSLLSVASDGIVEYIKAQVASACKKYMVVQDLKVDLSQLVGVEVSLEAVKYETKAEIIARQEAVVEAVVEPVIKEGI